MESEDMEFEVWQTSKLFSKIHKGSFFTPKIVDGVPYYYVTTCVATNPDPLSRMQYALDRTFFWPEVHLYLYLPMHKYDLSGVAFTIFRGVVDEKLELTLEEITRDEARVLCALIGE